MKRYDLFQKSKKVYEEKGDDPTKWKSPELTSVLRSLKVEGDAKLPTRIPEMLVVYGKWKERRVMTMDKPLPPPQEDGSDCESNDDGSAEGMEIFQGIDI